MLRARAVSKRLSREGSRECPAVDEQIVAGDETGVRRARVLEAQRLEDVGAEVRGEAVYLGVVDVLRRRNCRCASAQSRNDWRQLGACRPLRRLDFGAGGARGAGRHPRA